jgi:hypothetical protein
MSLATPEKIRTLQRKLYCKAKAEPAFRFYLLYDKICREDILAHAYALARANGGAPGVDGTTFRQIEAAGLEGWRAGLRKDLVARTYRPAPVRRVMIPKPGGGARPLGIPTIRDRVVQTAAKLVLEPIPRVRPKAGPRTSFEADLDPAAHGYRPGRSGSDAIRAVHALLCRGYIDVVDADLSRYFDTWPDVRDRLNRLLRGWSAYFGYGTRPPAYRAIDNHVYDRVRLCRHRTPLTNPVSVCSNNTISDSRGRCTSFREIYGLLCLPCQEEIAINLCLRLVGIGRVSSSAHGRRREAWTTVDPALIRGSSRMTKMRRGAASAWRTRVGSCDRHQTRNEGSPDPASPPPTIRASASCYRPIRPPCGVIAQAVLGSTMRAITQMKPISSRAIAVTTFGAALPAAMSRR